MLPAFRHFFSLRALDVEFFAGTNPGISPNRTQLATSPRKEKKTPELQPATKNRKTILPRITGDIM